MKLLISCWICLIGYVAIGQTVSLEAYQERHVRLQKGAMYTLGGWALVNIGSGLIGRSQNEGSNRYFHEMNAIWNVVNLGIAVPALIGAYQTDISQIDRIEALKRQQALERILMLNIGLNTGYIATGAFMIERSNRSDTKWKPERLKGYGQSLILQGGFLLLFDITQYVLYSRNAKKVMPKLLGSIRPTAQGIQISWTF